MSEEFKVYITKYALSDGISVEFPCEDPDKDSYVYIRNSYGFTVFGKNDYRLTKEDALARAEEMRQKKLKSLKKQIEKLENMTFEIKGEE